MSIATFESPQVASQRFFPWVFDEDVDYAYPEPEAAQELVVEAEVVRHQPVVTPSIRGSAVETRVGIAQPTPAEVPYGRQPAVNRSDAGHEERG